MKVLQLTEQDNVATALEEIKAGAPVEVILAGKLCARLTAITNVPYGFKICTKAMKKGDAVTKYAHCIGKASVDIRAGELVHVHNIEGNRGRGDLT